MKTDRKFRFAVAAMTVLALVAGLAGCASGTGSPQTNGTTETTEPSVTITISAAASLTDALDEVVASYESTHPDVTFSINYGASGTLEEQIAQGAVADIFFSASKKYVDALDEEGLIVEGTRTNVVGNELVVVVPSDSSLGISSLEDLVSADVEIVTLGDAEAVPAGKYAAQSLEWAGVFDAVSAKAVFGKDVKEVLTYVETGNADAGIVYATDALASDKVTVAFTIPSDSHDPIVYPAAVLNVGENQEAAQAFLEYLASDEAIAIFADYGFTAAE